MLIIAEYFRGENFKMEYRVYDMKSRYTKRSSVREGYKLSVKCATPACHAAKSKTVL